ncbi:MAG: hypothetical protein ISR34_10915 [Pirellulales bacterium]|jgi:hypothetical protein|nr:hypothetical protein [Pirellulales bacterium]
MDVDFKEACRLFWLIKGHLGADDKTIISCYDGYFKRLWSNNERAVYGMEGFDEAYNKKVNE